MSCCVLWALAALAVAAVAVDLSRLRGVEVVWRIGEVDGSCGEFALAPDGAREFARRFPEDPVYVVGESDPSEWPFIHPSEADVRWGGRPRHEFRVRFSLKRRPAGCFGLLVALADSHERLCPTMVVSVNGHEQRRRVEPGTGRAYFGQAVGRQQFLWFDVPAEWLRSGENEVSIRLEGGSWVAYDALALVRISRAATAGRRPGFRTNALTAHFGPLHHDFGWARHWRGQILAAAGHAGWIWVLAAPGQWLEIAEGIQCEHFEASFDVRAVDGRMALEYSAEGAVRPYWAVEWEPGRLRVAGGEWVDAPAGTWRVRVINWPTGARVEVCDVMGRQLFQGQVRHVPGPPGRFVLRGLEGLAQACVTNVHWTVPIAVRWRPRPARPGEAVEVELRAGERDDVTATAWVEAGGRYGRARRVQWSGQSERAALKLSVPDGFEGLGRLVVELRQSGRRGPILRIEQPVEIGAPAEAAASERPAGAYALQTPRGYVVGNGAFEVEVDRARGPVKLVERRRGRILADGPVLMTLNGRKLEAAVEAVEVKRENGQVVVQTRWRAGDLELEQMLCFAPGEEGFAERWQVKVGEAAQGPVDLLGLRCSFALRAFGRDGMLRPELEAVQFVPVPFRRETWAQSDFEDLTALQVIALKGWYRATGGPERTAVEEHGAEGWLWQWDDGGVLVAALNEQFMEWSLLYRWGEAEETVLRFGGLGAWHGDPQRWGWVGPGEAVQSGWKYYIAYRGDWRQGYYAFRELMARKGHGCPFDFDPPVHWNELYDNRLWWVGDSAENRRKYYRLEDMLWEAAKAAEVGCQALYLDPGWDTVFGSHIWDEERLGPVEEFVRLMRERYGLKVALHTPLADWASSGGGGRTYPPEAWRVDENGRVLEGRLCSGSRAYLEEQARRLIKLADAGIAYFMFDGSRYTGPCFARDHGHPVPYTRDDHVEAYRKLAEMIHRAHPEVIIEQHDQILAGVPSVYVPLYLGHGDGGFTERWAFEFMWHPLRDLLEGRALSLFYYNMAYNLPLYIHIDLRDDNENCLAFWWYASTCRHLGIGGTHPDGRNWQQVKRAMRRYLELQDFFKRGAFYGLDETVHIHSLPDRGAVVVVFNLTGRRQERRFVLNLAEIGLEPRGRLRVIGAEHMRLGDAVELRVELEPYSARIVEVHLPGR